MEKKDCSKKELGFLDGIENDWEIGLWITTSSLMTTPLQDFIRDELCEKWFISTSIKELSLKFNLSESEVIKQIEELADYGLFGQLDLPTQYECNVE